MKQEDLLVGATRFGVVIGIGRMGRIGHRHLLGKAKKDVDSFERASFNYIRSGYIRENDSAMAMSETNAERMLPLTPAVFHVLLALVEGERHGYAIMQEVAESTQGQIKMGPGTLYGTIKRLLEARLIEESDRRPDPELDDERRRYYRLTGLGQQVVKAEALRYERLAKLARRKRLLGQTARVGQGRGL